MRAATITAIFGLLTSWFAVAQQQTASADTNSLPHPDTTSVIAVPHSGPAYVIGVEDVLHVAVWQEQELTTSVPVRTDGKISLPLLNDVQAAGLTPMQLSGSIAEKLKKYIDDPRVTVVVTRMKPERVYLVGEVLHAGPIELTHDMTVLEALVTAGFTPFANTKKVYVLRSINGTQQRLPVNYKRMIKGDKPQQNVLLHPGDVIVVP